MRYSVGASLPAFPASLTFIGVHQDGTILLFLIKDSVGACLYADGILAVVTHNWQDMKPGIGEDTFLPLVNAHPLYRTRRDIVPLFAGNDTGVTANTATLVDEKAILCHYDSPWYFSI